VAGGFTTLIIADGRPAATTTATTCATRSPAAAAAAAATAPTAVLWGPTLHNFTSTFYAPLLFKPASYAAGLRCLFGDQSLWCRAADFEAVGGYRERLPLMEDLALVLDLHAAGPVDAAAGASGPRQPWHGRGRVRQLGPPVATTSGRRFQGWGSGAVATATHFAIALAWYGGAPPGVLKRVVDALYPAVSEVR
jgi:hypothetical protein